MAGNPLNFPKFSLIALILAAFVLPGLYSSPSHAINNNEQQATGTSGYQTPTADTSDYQTPAPTSNSPAHKPLTGQIRGMRLLGTGSLGQLGSIAESLKKSCLVVMSEITQQQAVPGNGPNIVGTSIIPATPNVTGMVYMGQADPRSAVLAGAINSIIAYSKRLEDQIATTVVPTDAPEYAKELWDKIHEISEKLHADLFDLATLARNKDAQYNTTKMGKLALRIYDKSEAMNKLRRRILEELRRSQ